MKLRHICKVAKFLNLTISNKKDKSRYELYKTVSKKLKISITMKKTLIILSIGLLIQSKIIAQNENDRAYIVERTNTKVLNEISEKCQNNYLTNLAEERKQGLKTEITNSRNEKGYLSGFDSEGKPIYDFDDNINSAITSRVNAIWNGGSSGLNLDGSGIQIGHWEAGGLALPTHQELSGKITHGENENITGHATHTACTMIGTGINNDARGMASGSTIISRRSNNDESEIANFGAAGGILSNHSYSTGDPDGNTPLYGVYTDNAREWDEILFNAPYLTLCKSAGNNRNDGIANIGDNGYDIIYTVAGSKNLITVGAVRDVIVYNGPESITQYSFSNWGPTDDWRIKPDITANGVTVFSADNDNDTDYGVRNGTSMSTASVTGAIALLQQHYHNENGVYMKAATVKALLTGTADEAGANDGPDFQSGWGLLNAERAAEAITNHGTLSRINELTLANGNAYTTTVEVDGTLPLALTIVWTDPAGNPVSGGIDNQTPMLVNDLDVRIFKDGIVFEPWTMTPNTNSNNFTDAATKGDNFRDNVERIDISNLPQGIYTVTVTHKGSLVNGSQDFSMVITGISNNALGLQDLENPNNSFLIYPNPSKNGYFNISIQNEDISDNYKIEIFDLLGKLIERNVYHEKDIKYNVSNLNSGLFILKIQVNNKIYSQLIAIDN